MLAAGNQLCAESDVTVLLVLSASLATDTIIDPDSTYRTGRCRTTSTNVEWIHSVVVVVVVVVVRGILAKIIVLC